MSDSDLPTKRDEAAEPSRAAQSRLASLEAEVGLRDRELTALRNAVDGERAQARAARLLAEENLKEAEYAAHVQQQLEQAANEIRNAYSELRMRHDRLAVELEAARTQALERAERAEAACAAAEAGRQQAEQARDTAVELAAEAERSRQASEGRLGAEIQRVTAALAAARERAEQERRDATTASAEALTALAAAEYRRRTRYENTIGELKSAHAAALEQAVRAEAERAAIAALSQRLERERDEATAKVADGEKVIARGEERIRTLLEGDAAHRAEAETLRTVVVARERDVEAAQLAEQSVLEVLTGVRASLADQAIELESSRARASELAARVATTAHEYETLRAAAAELAAAYNDAQAAVAAEREQLHAHEATCAALRATLATRERELAEQRDARVAAEEAAAHAAEPWQARVDTQAAELAAARAEMMGAVTELTAAREQLQLLDAARAAAEQQAAELLATDVASARKLAEALATSAALAAELDSARIEWAAAQREYAAMREWLDLMTAAQEAAEQQAAALHSAHAADAREVAEARATVAALAEQLDAARIELGAAQGEYAAMRERLDLMTAARDAAEQQAAALHAAHAADAREVAEARAATAAFAEKLNATRIALGTAQGEYAAMRERLGLMTAAREAAEEQAAALHATHAADAREVAEARATNAALAAELDAARQALAAATAAHGAAVERWQATAATAHAQADDLHRELAARDRSLQALEAERLQWESERDTRELALREAARQHESRAAELDDELVARTRQRDQVQAALDQRRSDLKAAVTEGVALRDDLRTLRERLIALEELPALRARCEAAEAARQAAEADAERCRQAIDESADEQGRLCAQIAQLEQRLQAANDIELRQCAEAERATDAELQRERAARSGLQEELARTRETLEASRAQSRESEGRVAAAERAVQLAAAQRTQLEEQARQWQDQLLDREAQLTAVGVDLARERSARAALQAAFDELRARGESERAAATDAHAHRAAAEAERDELRRELAELSTAHEALQGERDRLSAQAREVDTLEEPSQGDGPAPMSGAETEPEPACSASGIARLNVLTNQRLLDQVRALEQVCEPGMDGLSTLRRHRELFEQRFRASDGNGGHGGASEPPDGAETSADTAFATDERRTTVRRHRAQTTRTPDRSVAEPPSAAIVLAPGEELTVVHVEHHAPLRDAVRAAVERHGYARYAALQDILPGSEGSQHLLAVNMLAPEIDPLSTICDPRWPQQEARAFIYLSAGSRGIVAGLVDFILYPLDPNDCATRLLQRTGGIQRLLMVSDKIDAMNEIRTVLNRLECSTSLALDDRQGLNLVGMVKPDAILIDLTLPRAGGVRLITQIRSNPSLAGVTIVFALAEPFDAGRFQTEAGRVLGECRFSSEELSAALGQVLSQVQIADASPVPATA